MKLTIKKTLEQILKEVKEREKQYIALDLQVTEVDISAKECKALCKEAGYKDYKEGDENRIIAFRMSSEKGDLGNEVVMQKGLSLKVFKENPVIFWRHNRSFSERGTPIGQGIKAWYDEVDNSNKVWVLFLDDTLDRSGLSEDIFKMVKAKVLKKGSIGFDAKSKDIRLATDDEIKKYKLEKYGIIFEKSLLLEFSVVPIGMNPDSTVIKREMFRENTIKMLEEKGYTFADEESKDAPIEDTPIEKRVKPKIGADDDGNLTVDGKTLIELFETTFSEKLNELKEDIIKGQKVNDILNKGDKVIIERALTSIKDVKETLEAILETAKVEDTSTSSKGDHNDSPSEDEPDEESTNVMNMLETASSKLKQ